MAKGKKRIKNQKPYRPEKWDAKIFKPGEQKEAPAIKQSDDEKVQSN